MTSTTTAKIQLKNLESSDTLILPKGTAVKFQGYHFYIEQDTEVKDFTVEGSKLILEDGQYGYIDFPSNNAWVTIQPRKVKRAKPRIKVRLNNNKSQEFEIQVSNHGSIGNLYMVYSNVTKEIVGKFTYSTIRQTWCVIVGVGFRDITFPTREACYDYIVTQYNRRAEKNNNAIFYP